MENVWIRINNDVPKYMKNMCDKYNLFCIKVSSLKTALVGKRFALIIAIDRFYVTVSYLYMEDKDIKIYSCGNYFAEKYDNDDRINLVMGEGVENIIRNNIIIIANGLLSKWKNVLEGEMGWIENYKKSKWFSVERLLPEEIDKIKQYF